jgi:predicted amidohydrolase YtcJ
VSRIDNGCPGLLPGLIDAHAHMNSLASELAHLNITGTESFAEVIRLVEERVRAAAPGEWIVGGRWDQNDWADKSLAIRRMISPAEESICLLIKVSPATLQSMYAPEFAAYSSGAVLTIK